MCRRHRLVNPKVFPADRIPEWTHHRRSWQEVQHLLPKVLWVPAVSAPEKAGNSSMLAFTNCLHVSRRCVLTGTSKPVPQQISRHYRAGRSDQLTGPLIAVHLSHPNTPGEIGRPPIIPMPNASNRQCSFAAAAAW